jgi:hypothetical protein
VSEAWVVNASPLILFARIARLDLIERLAPTILHAFPRKSLSGIRSAK